MGTWGEAFCNFGLASLVEAVALADEELIDLLVGTLGSKIVKVKEGRYKGSICALNEAIRFTIRCL